MIRLLHHPVQEAFCFTEKSLYCEDFTTLLIYIDRYEKIVIYLLYGYIVLYIVRAAESLHTS